MSDLNGDKSLLSGTIWEGLNSALTISRVRDELKVKKLKVSHHQVQNIYQLSILNNKQIAMEAFKYMTISITMDTKNGDDNETNNSCE